jgi:hypothetical protein
MNGSGDKRRANCAGGHFDDVRLFISELYGPDLHAKRVDSLAGATLGVIDGGVSGSGDGPERFRP